MGVTIKEVARRAGVSVATVSRVFNDSGPVNNETRLRVEQAAEDLRYVPNLAARSLITNTSFTLGVLLPDLYGEFFSEVIRGIDQTSREHGYHILVSSSHSDEEEIKMAIQAMHGRVDGLIIMSPLVNAEALGEMLPPQVPVVFLSSSANGSAYGCINVDNYGGAYSVVQHLIGLGHRQIAMVTGSQDNFDSRERLRGYREALRDHGITGSEDLVVAGDFSEASGYAAAAELLARTPRPTALFAANDAMAVGAIGALHEAGVAVPDDIAVVGFDDIPIAQYMRPSLTSVHISISALGAQAVDHLLDAIDGGPPSEGVHVTVPTTLVVRESCGASTAEGTTPPRAP